MMETKTEWVELQHHVYFSSTLIMFLNTLLSGHVERHDCYPMYCWQVTSFCISLHNIIHMRLSAGLTHLLLQGYWQLDAGLGLKLQINQSWPPIFRTIRFQQIDLSFMTHIEATGTCDDDMALCQGEDGE
jgi:hypothetical protein